MRGALAVIIGTTLGVSLSLMPSVHADRYAADASKSELPWEAARAFAEVLERVKHDYVEDVDDEELIESAIRGMIAELDPHSAYLDADEFQEVRISTTGSYSGVGLEVTSQDGQIVVVSPIDDTPAFHAGIEPGDIIVKVDGYDIDTGNTDNAVRRMRGSPGTEVDVEVLRAGEPEPLAFTLKRERIRVASVRGRTLEDGFGYLRITQFSETTGRDLRDSVRRLRDSNGGALKGVVLDLRNNPGGVLDSAVAVSDAFLDDGIIVTADGRTRDSNFKHEAEPGDLLNGASMVVLVNAGSASASEIVAGALQDHERALIMGDRTFGKGSVQTVMRLSRGGALKLTTSKYFTPSGDSIHDLGIIPDVEIAAEQPEEEPLDLPDESPLRLDYQLYRALSYLKQNHLAHAEPNTG